RARQRVAALARLQHQVGAIAGGLARAARIAALAADDAQSFRGVRAGKPRRNGMRTEDVQERVRSCRSESDLAVLLGEVGFAERRRTGPLGYLPGGAAPGHVTGATA